MRTSTPDLDRSDDQPQGGPHISPTTEGDFHLEAASVEAAVADVRRRTGRDPQVLSVESVARGGIGGFFAKELVRVHVRIASSGPASPTRPVPASERIAEARPRGVDGVLHALTNENDLRERSFDRELRRAIAETPVAEPVREDPVVVRSPEALFGDRPVAPAPTPVVAAPTPVVESPVIEAPVVEADTARTLMAKDVFERLHGAAPVDVRTSLEVADEVLHGELLDDEAPVDESLHDGVVHPTSSDAPASPNSASPTAKLDRGSPLASAPAIRPGAGWSRDALYAMGLPGSVLDRVEVYRGADEFTWLRAMSEAVSPWCRALPSDSSVLVGPKAGALGAALGIPVADRKGRVPYGGDVALVATDSAAARAWVDDVRGDRWLHLVMGGRRWEGLMADQPRAVSVVGRQFVPEALALCASFDLVLGHLVRQSTDDVALRLTPLDVALAVREQLPRAEGA